MFCIKILAVTFMVIDHIGAFLFPQFFAFRMIGRLSFILFAWLIANGARHTKHPKQYLIRLFAFGCISQIPYTLLLRTAYPGFWEWNIFFTLSLGLIAIHILGRFGRPYATIPLIAVGVFFIEFFIGHMTYGVYGVLSILLFYTFFTYPKKMLISQATLAGLFYTLPLFFTGLPFGTLYTQYPASLAQPLGLLAIPIIASYNGNIGPKMKWLFYAFYPVHLLILYGIRMFIF